MKYYINIHRHRDGNIMGTPAWTADALPTELSRQLEDRGPLGVYIVQACLHCTFIMFKQYNHDVHIQT